MIEAALRKRPALYKGEVGLFACDEMAAEDMQLISNNSDVLVKMTTPKHLEQLRYIWALATKVSEACVGIYDKEDGINFLCTKARYMKFVVDPNTGEVELKRKSLSRVSAETLRRLTDRMVYITCSEIIPGLSEEALKGELAKMVGVKT